MDFLDPKKQRQHTILLYTGYILIAIAILISTVVLVYQANCYGVNSKRQVIQCGLVFVSSQPSSTQIYLNTKREGKQTNARLSLPAAQYQLQLKRPDYRSWQHTLDVQGGDVQHFDYPFLFPVKLTSKPLSSNLVNPSLASQSPDRRWLVLQTGADNTSFTVYDLKNPSQITPTALTLPATVVTPGTTQSWQVVGWADDNLHLLLAHSYDGATEYIEVDRSDGTQAVNLTKTLDSGSAVITLDNNKYDQYYLFDSKTATLSTADLNDKTSNRLLSNVLSFKSYGTNTVLYATADGAPTGKVDINMLVASQTYLLRQVTASPSYLLDMASYSGTPYVVIGAGNEAYIYKDPLSQLNNNAIQLPAAIRAFGIAGLSYVGFSPNAQFIISESGPHFAIYDIFGQRAYQYSLAKAFDTPQLHAVWMDGDRLTYVSGGKLLVMDFDHTNSQSLLAASPNYAPFFSADYHYLYVLAPTGTTMQLTQTPLLIPADL